MKKLLSLFLLSAGLAMPAAAADYPAKPLRFVTIGGPGSGSDLIARALAEPMSQGLRQPIVVEAQLGAGGTIAAQHVLNAGNDGYTLLVVTPAHLAAGLLYPNLKYNALRDFSGVALLAELPNVLVAPPQRGWTSTAELLAAARKEPGKQNFGTAGVGSGTHMSAERFRNATRIDAQHVPYKSSPEVLNEVAAGRIDWHFAPLPSALALIKAGRLHPLAISAQSRSRELPEVPTLRELGLADGDFRTWVALLAPAGVPRAVVQRLNDEANRALQLPAVREKLAMLQAAPLPMKPDELDRFLQQESQVSESIIRTGGIKLQ